MSFLTPILLAGTSAFLIPLIIHLLNRRRVIPVAWGAMHLLHEVIRQRKRRMQIEQWLLLLIRLAIPIILALALARPVLNSLRQLPGLGGSSLIILLDDSLSMQAETAEGSSALEAARAEVQRLLDDLPDGSDAQVILMADPPRAFTASARTDLTSLWQSLTDVSAERGPISPQNALTAALAAAGKAQHSAREIVLISDFQKTDWQSLADGAQLPALAAEAEKKDSERPSVTFFRIATDTTENLAIEQADLSAQVVAAGQPVALKVTVRNHGDRPWQDIAAHLEADGTRIKTSRLSLPPQGEGSLLFTHAFDEVGDHSLTVRVDGDSFTADNAFHTIVQVRDQIAIALLEGAPGREPLSGSLDFLELALSPHLQTHEASLRDLLITRRLDPARLKESDLADVRVAILGGMDRLRGNVFPLLKNFAEKGGGVWLLPSESLDPLAWDKEAEKAQGLLPAHVTGQDHVKNADFPARLQAERFTHPALAYFNDPRTGRIGEAEIQHWWVLDPVPEARTVLSLDNGRPALVEHAVGRGLVLMSALPLRPGWSNIPLQPWFVPLTQRLTAWLAIQDTEGSWQRLGQTATLALAPGENNRPFTLTTPSGETQNLTSSEAAEAPTLDLGKPERPGIYSITPSAGRNALTRRLAVNLDPAETDLTPLPEADWQALAQRLGVGAVRSFDEWQRLDRSRRFGSEIWQPLILALLALLFFEVLLQQHITRRK